ncbi:MAG: CoF synthetase [Phycisphaerales bacterium]
MPVDLNDAVARCVDLGLRVCRVPPLNSTRVYGLLGMASGQRLLERIGRRRGVAAFRRARRRCPAYARFLRERGYTDDGSLARFSEIPETNKQNYITVYTIEERCFGGAIPPHGVVIDESSGSSGTPNNWVRSSGERAGVRRLLRHGLAMRFRDRSVFLINCFALGPWATGMCVTMSLADRCIVKSVGPDKLKLENTLRMFGTRYEYIIAGYPPFIKDFLDTTTLDLSGYAMDLLVGGEGIAEPVRDRFLRVFRSVYSSFGASDLEINLAGETPLSIAVRRLCLGDAALCRGLFDRDDPPMLFQYNPLDCLIETNDEGELIFTLLRPGYAAPKIRYNLRDVGGTFSHRDLMLALHGRGIDSSALPSGPAFPFLFVGGRSDMTVGFYGAKVYTSDLDAVIAGVASLRDRVHSFQVRVEHDREHTERLRVDLERAASDTGDFDEPGARRAVFEGLVRVNQDFREVSKMFGEEGVVVRVHPFGGGPFAGRDVRVKNRYLAETPRV